MLFAAITSPPGGVFLPFTGPFRNRQNQEAHMALFGRDDYDLDYGREYQRSGVFGARNRGERGFRGDSRHWSGEDDRDYYRSMRGYVGGDRGYANLGYDRGYRASGYDRGYSARDGYGRDYERKSRWQTDHGDPYGDRTSHTPMRVIHGSFEGRQERNRSDSGWFGRGRSNRYERDYSSNPMGYDPYPSRESSMERGWGMRDFDRGSSRGGRGNRDW
jgi:hypothetical protein